eukprot:scaffold216562_cov65-Attheya_sp.AAC.2
MLVYIETASAVKSFDPRLLISLRTWLESLRWSEKHRWMYLGRSIMHGPRFLSACQIKNRWSGPSSIQGGSKSD